MDASASDPAASQAQSAEETPPEATSEPTQGSGLVDVDLTKLSGTMVYSEVYHLIYNPDDYIGKTVKMEGQFAYYENPDTKDQYFWPASMLIRTITRSRTRRSQLPAPLKCMKRTDFSTAGLWMPRLWIKGPCAFTLIRWAPPSGRDSMQKFFNCGRKFYCYGRILEVFMVQ